MASELMHLFDHIARENSIEKNVLAKVVEAALISASRKNYGLENVPIYIEERDNTVKFMCKKKVVVIPTIPFLEISEVDAKKIDQNVQLNDFIPLEIDLKDFGRNAAQTAKQVIMQKLREMAKELVFKEFKSKKGEIVSGTIYNKDNKGIIVNLGKVNGVLPLKEQIPTETYNLNEQMSFYLLDVYSGVKGNGIILSRSYPEFVRKLFEQEIPEISEGIIQIKSISREPGQRSKIAVISSDRNVDPVGACVGMKGSRIHTIIDELKGERIDIIHWSEDCKTFIANSLSPAKIAKVTLDEKNKRASILVPRDQLSLAIGKHGQNVRLSAKLTNWKIDISVDEGNNPKEANNIKDTNEKTSKEGSTKVSNEEGIISE